MCLGQGADLHMAQLMPLPLTISCSIKSRLVLFTLPGFTFLVSAYSGSFGQNPHTHTHNRFTALLEFVWDYPGDQIPET